MCYLMKHFIFAFFLVILCLGQPDAYAQDNPHPSPAPLPEATKQDERPAEEGDKKEETYERKADSKSLPLIIDKDVSRKEIPILSTSDKISKKANFWAMWQAIFGLGTLLLAGFATWFAWGAWQAGNDAVAVGEATLSETQKANERSLRAYVVVDNFEIVDFEVGKRLYFIVHFVNCGQTPAYDIRTNIQSNLKFSGKANRILFPKKAGYSGILAAGNQGVPMAVRHSANLTKAQMVHFQNGALELVVGGFLTYLDIYKVRRRLIYKYYARWEPHVGTQSGTIIFSTTTSKRGNRAT